MEKETAEEKKLIQIINIMNIRLEVIEKILTTKLGITSEQLEETMIKVIKNKYE